MHFSTLLKWDHTDHADTQVYMPSPLFSNSEPFRVTSKSMTGENLSQLFQCYLSSFTEIPAYPQFSSIQSATILRF